MQVPEVIATVMQHLPDTPGVYLWKDERGVVLYVGKSRNLRARVRSYYAADTLRTSLKTEALMRQARALETIVVPTEEAALVLEANLIKEHKPRFNILLRDDKSYPWIKVTVAEEFPRVFVTRRLVNDGSRYFGPYTDVGAMRRSLALVKRVYTIRSCSYNLPVEAPDRPCLDFHIGRCMAPCVGYQSREDYRAMIGEVVAFLNGSAGDILKRVRSMMEDAALRLDFERAAVLRDAMAGLQQMQEPTVVTHLTVGDCDVLGMARDGDDACVAILRVRGGKLLAREHRMLEHVEGESDAQILGAYLSGGYLQLNERAPQLLLPFEPEGPDLIQKALGTTALAVPGRGSKREMVDMAEQNARHLLEEFKLASMEVDERAADPVYELARALGLEKLPRAMVCFDISTAQGKDTTASFVWFENGRPRRSYYRKLRVRSVEGTDDFASMREAVTRVFTRLKEDGRSLPDLVVVDGGKGQLGAAVGALADVEQGDLPVISLAKRDEEIFVRGRSDPLRLPRRSPALKLLQRIRDEAHRVAVEYNRKRRSMRTVTSELLSIPGVGPTRRTALLRAFGSLQGVRDASEEAIAALPGFSHALAAKIKGALQQRQS